MPLIFPQFAVPATTATQPEQRVHCRIRAVWPDLLRLRLLGALCALLSFGVSIEATPLRGNFLINDLEMMTNSFPAGGAI